jgi:hypothetical protein
MYSESVELASYLRCFKLLGNQNIVYDLIKDYVTSCVDELVQKVYAARSSSLQLSSDPNCVLPVDLFFKGLH